MDCNNGNRFGEEDEEEEGNRKRTVVYDGTESQTKKPKLKPSEPLDADNNDSDENESTPRKKIPSKVMGGIARFTSDYWVERSQRSHVEVEKKVKHQIDVGEQLLQPSLIESTSRKTSQSNVQGGITKFTSDNWVERLHVEVEKRKRRDGAAEALSSISSTAATTGNGDTIGASKAHPSDNMKKSRADVTDEQRVTAAIEAVGVGAERQKKLGSLLGVYQRPNGKWLASGIKYGNKSRYIGLFDSKVEAGLAYEIARQLLKTAEEDDIVCWESRVDLAKKKSGIERC